MKNYPLYKQIQVDILRLIKTGKLRPGDRVPSEKELAEQYRVSQITSKNALIGLADDGILVRVQGKGTFVKQDGEKAGALDISKNVRDVIGLILPCMKTKVDQKILDSIEKYLQVCFWVGAISHIKLSLISVLVNLNKHSLAYVLPSSQEVDDTSVRRSYR